MGETDYKKRYGTNGKSDGTVKAGNPESGTGNSGNRNPDTGKKGTGERKPDKLGSSGPGPGTGAEKKPSAEVGGLPDVNIPVPVEPGTKPKKPRKTKTKKEESATFNADQITALLVAVFGMVASREGCQHWALTKSEAEQIAKPLANIIEKNESLKGLSEHADGIALVTACVMIILPRAVISVQSGKQKKALKKKGVKPNAGTLEKNDKRSPGRPEPDVKIDVNPVFESIPAL